MVGLFGDSVPRALHDEIVASIRREVATRDQTVVMLLSALDAARLARDKADERYAALVAEVMELKRHDIGALPKGAYDAALHADPRAELGEKTNLAIDEFAAGDQELVRHLVAQAQLHTAMLRAETDGPAELDERVAQLILAGDTA